MFLMGKAASFYDWELRFQRAKSKRKQKRINALGMYHHQFKQFLNEWKKKNFPMKKTERK